MVLLVSREVQSCFNLATNKSASIPRPMFAVATSDIQPRLSSYVEVTQHTHPNTTTTEDAECSALKAATEFAQQLVNGSSGTSGSGGSKINHSSAALTPAYQTKGSITDGSSIGTRGTRDILRDPSGSVRYASLEAIVNLMCDPNEDSHFDISSVVRLTYSQYCISTDLVLVMIKTLDHFMAAENYRRQSMLIGELKLLVEHLAKHSKRGSSDSMNALDVLELYIEKSLEEDARSVRERKDLNMVAVSLSRVRISMDDWGGSGSSRRSSRSGSADSVDSVDSADSSSNSSSSSR